jgi:hypothetical protein
VGRRIVGLREKGVKAVARVAVSASEAANFMIVLELRLLKTGQ